MSLDRQKVKDYRRQIQNVLDMYAKEMGVVIKLGNIRFSEHSFTTKLELIEAGSKNEAEKMKWEKVCHRYGLEPEDYGKEVTIAGDRCRIVCLNTRSTKYPLVVERLDRGGKRYKYKLTDTLRNIIRCS